MNLARALVVLCAVTFVAQPVHADIAPTPFDFSEDFSNFGRQPNFCPATNPKGVCAAVAAINSFFFLENQYPAIYDNKLTPNGAGAKPNQTDMTDATEFGTDGWQVGANPARAGYYTRPGDAYTDYVATKQDWINDRAPGTTSVEGRFADSGGVPDVQWLAEQIQKGQDVEFFVQGMDFFHALTLVGVACLDNNFTECSLGYQDPNDPSTLQSAALSEGAGGILQFTGLPGSKFDGAVSITGAFAESPIPEPAYLCLLGMLMLGLIASRIPTIKNR